MEDSSDDEDDDEPAGQYQSAGVRPVRPAVASKTRQQERRRRKNQPTGPITNNDELFERIIDFEENELPAYAH